MDASLQVILIAVIGLTPGLLVYFGNRRKGKAEVDSLDDDRWNKFTQRLEQRLEEVNRMVAEQGTRITTQDATIASQNQTIAMQNVTIVEQTARINLQDTYVHELTAGVEALTAQLEKLGYTPVYKIGAKKAAGS